MDVVRRQVVVGSWYGPTPEVEAPEPHNAENLEQSRPNFRPRRSFVRIKNILGPLP